MNSGTGETRRRRGERGQASVRAPYGIESMRYEVKAGEKTARNGTAFGQPEGCRGCSARVVQATLAQIEKTLLMWKAGGCYSGERRLALP
jgi:hypothetical protein